MINPFNISRLETLSLSLYKANCLKLVLLLKGHIILTIYIQGDINFSVKFIEENKNSRQSNKENHYLEEDFKMVREFKSGLVNGLIYNSENG